jgi:hypothetical protein
MESQSSAARFSTPIATPTRTSHKRRRSAMTSSAQPKDTTTSCSFSATESCCTTSGESSGDESDDTAFELDELEEEQMQEAKRRRRADLDGIKKSMRQMEAQVVEASAQLRDLAAMVAQVVARRQRQLQLA